MGLSDENIMSLLAITNAGDLEAGLLAKEKASHPQVRSYAARMIAEHSAMSDGQNRVAANLKINPTEPVMGQKLVKAQEEAMEMLRNKSGREFDDAYMDREIMSHADAIGFVDHALTSTQREEVKGLLEQTKVLLQAHLDSAQRIKKNL
jgi:putative membrane protein